MNGELFTLGHGNRRIADFLKILDRYEINLLVDVRTSPYSKYMVEYNKKELENLLGSRYTWRGDILGGMRPLRAPGFSQGIKELLELKKQGNICIMCSELEPENCHREQWIASDLRSMGENVKHILKDGSIMGSYQGKLV